VINEDRELELWKEEWRAETGPFPELKKRVRQRTLRMIAANVAALGMLVWCLAFPARIAMRDPSQENIVSAAGECFLALLASVFVVRSQIGVWRPQAQNTRAYAELLYKRALYDVQAVRFAFYLFWTAAFVVACIEWILMPKWPVVRAHPAQHLARLGFDLLLFLGMWMFLICNKRRKLQQFQEAKSFLEELECHGLTGGPATKVEFQKALGCSLRAYGGRGLSRWRGGRYA